MELILYSKPGCHLCSGLQEKLEQIRNLEYELEIRNINNREDWFNAYQYEVPVLCQKMANGSEKPLPRLSPRATVAKLEQMLQKNLMTLE